MGRTAESYLIETGIKPIEMLYPFAEWPTQRLLDELDQEQAHLEALNHSASRRGQLERRIAHLCFEVEWRGGLYE